MARSMSEHAQYLRIWKKNNPEKVQRYKDENREKSRKRAADRYAARRVIYRNVRIGRSCSCGESHPACIDFHHRDASTKRFSVCNWTTSLTLTEDDLRQEVEKCDPVCANCHRKLHYAGEN